MGVTFGDIERAHDIVRGNVVRTPLLHSPKLSEITGAEIYVNSGNRSPFRTNLHDFGPRLGFAWQAGEHFVMRGGAGIYYGPSTHNVGSAGLNTDGFSSQTTWDGTCVTANGNTTFNGSSLCSGAAPGSPAPSFTGPFSLSNPFPNGTTPIFSSAPPGLANNLGTTLTTVLRSQRTPTTYNFNFALEYELPRQVVVTIGYVGSRGLFLPFGNVDLNQLDLATIQKYGSSLCIDSDPTCSTAPNPFGPINPNFPGATAPLWFTLQPFPQFGNGNYGSGNGVIVNGYPAGDSEYSSLQSKVQKRLTHHFTTLATFTWGKIMTDNGNPPLGFVGYHNGGAQDWRDLRYEHSISPQDVKYQFSGSASYDLPVGKGQAVNLNGVSNDLLGGWTINAILYLSTGVPIASPTSGVATQYFNQRADLTCNPASGAPHTATTWFNPDCFAIPSSPLIPGTAPAYLDNVRTAGARDLDLSIYKTFQIAEGKALRFDISSYNITNKAQFGYPNVPDITSVQTQPGVAASFGQITNTVNTPRQFQFGARFTF